MLPRTLRTGLMGGALCVAATVAAPQAMQPGALGGPRLVLWAWERPEHLDFIDPQRVAVAFLAETLVLDGDNVVATPRRQPLAVPTDASLIAVVRIEMRQRRRSAFPHRAEVVAAILAAFRRTGATALQIDFDASLSERVFYGTLLSDLRRRLPQSTDLSMTALASWCMDDPWIARLPVDHAVPMLFRMGSEGPVIRRRLAHGEALSLPLCRSDVGLSMDEPWVDLGGRHWVFNPASWTPDSVREALRAASERRRK